MRILPNNIAILDEPDQLCAWVEESGKLCHDPGVAKHYLPFINRGDVVIDAGAAIGDHTIAYMEKTGDPALVHAFECNPKMLECLIYNCARAHIHPFALSCRNGQIGFIEIEGNFGASFVHGYGITQVECVTLDSLNFQKIDFIKWDIEGHEYTALIGAGETIKRCRPRMIMEFNEPFLNRCGSCISDLEIMIFDLGYSIECIMGSRAEGRYEGLCLPK